MNNGSAVCGFYKLDIKKRHKIVKKFAKLSEKDLKLLKGAALSLKTADRMVENVVGTTHLPLGLGLNFLINGRDYMVPMALEEPSVIAAASHAAKLARPTGGFVASSDDPLMIGQIQLTGIKKLKRARKLVLKNKARIKEMANSIDSTIVNLGGGVKDVNVNIIKTKNGKMLIVHLIVDVRDAMGANIINTMCEYVSPYLVGITGGKIGLRIVSNLATKRMARARAVWSKDIIGKETVDNIIKAYAFAEADAHRCATHNKGIMNGIDAVLIATGNDFRAVEAGAHAYASNGGYKCLTKYEKDRHGNLIGSIEIPMAIGIVGGATKTHPVANVSLKILGVKNAQELASVIASVGLAQNFAALRALATEGIQKGHMELHASNIAIIAGAKGSTAEKISKRLIKERNISVSRAKELMKMLFRRKRKIIVKRTVRVRVK
jgi:hydroxymethylglutaryl-CoA reductase